MTAQPAQRKTSPTISTRPAGTSSRSFSILRAPLAGAILVRLFMRWQWIVPAAEAWSRFAIAGFFATEITRTNITRRRLRMWQPMSLVTPRN